MTEQTNNSAFNPFLQPYLEFWGSYVEQADETTRRMFDSLRDGADLRAWQRRWLETVSRSTAAYLRSPSFLKAMKQSLDAAVRTKMQVDDLQKEFARNANIPTADDISGLFERLRGIEELILSRLGDVEKRLGAIECGLTAQAQADGEAAASQAVSEDRPSTSKRENTTKRRPKRS